MKRLARIGVGGVLIAVGVLGVLFALVGILDPQGSKLADDGEPFGTVSKTEGWLTLLAYAGTVIVGALVAGLRPWRRGSDPQPKPPLIP